MSPSGALANVAELRIVAFGDSVTYALRPDNSIPEERTWRALLERRLQSKFGNARRVRVINAGVGGDTTLQGLARMDQDVLSHAPHWVLIMFGLNDASMIEPGPIPRRVPRLGMEQFRENLRLMVERCRVRGIKAVLMTPTPMNESHPARALPVYGEHPINYMLERYAAVVREVASEVCAPLIDVYDYFIKRDDLPQLFPDGVHPNVDGNRILGEFIAEELLRIMEVDTG